MSISARTLLLDTNAISIPEKNPDRSSEINTIINGINILSNASAVGKNKTIQTIKDNY